MFISYQDYSMSPSKEAHAEEKETAMSYQPEITKAARGYHEKMLPGYQSDFVRTDPEFIERFDNFAFDEVVNAEGSGGGDLDGRTRFMAVLAALLGCQAVDEFRAMLPAALNFGVTPVEAKEIIYQAVAYMGIGRVFPFLRATNEVLEGRGVELPLEGQSTTTMDTRLEAGIEVQVATLGEGMRNFWRSGEGDAAHMNRWLTANCFGDWYTRSGLNLAEREMITFCFIAAQGGCEPQLVSHAVANMNVGNEYAFLVAVVSQCVPYIGYPRSLNALRCVDEAAKGRDA